MAIDWKERLHDEVDTLRQARDELRVQMHLGAADAKDVWAKVEKSWEHLEGRLKRIGDVTQEAADEVEDATRLLVDEIKEGYQKIRKAL
jgi:uncharacterized protein YjbJ (UPF0337 family)